MCGIAGIVALTGSTAIDPAIVRDGKRSSPQAAQSRSISRRRFWERVLGEKGRAALA
jgi:hypothetical protein